MFDMNQYTDLTIPVKQHKTNYHNISKPCLILYSNCTCLKIKLNLFSILFSYSFTMCFFFFFALKDSGN